MFQGDLGTSMVYDTSVTGLVFSRLPATLELVGVSVTIAALIGIPAGIWAGYRPDSLGAKAIMALSILGFSVPTFWIGMLLIMAFAVELGWLPSGGRGDVAEFLWFRTSLATADGWSHVILPAINLSLFKMGLLIRLTRAGMVEAMGAEYVKFARAQGLPDRQIVFGHVLRNISIPIVTVFGLELGSTLAFAVVTESVFNWPGVGKLIIDSILVLDRPVMVSYLVLVVILFVLINLVVDLARARLDPRVRLEGRRLMTDAATTEAIAARRALRPARPRRGSRACATSGRTSPASWVAVACAGGDHPAARRRLRGARC